MGKNFALEILNGTGGIQGPDSTKAYRVLSPTNLSAYRVPEWILIITEYEVTQEKEVGMMAHIGSEYVKVPNLTCLQFSFSDYIRRVCFIQVLSGF